MLTKAGTKLMDFGLAKDSSPAAAVLTEMTADDAKLTVEGTIVGTFQYMPRNNWKAKRPTRARIFSL